jgi:transglutaminase-like putative cysteine protease
MRAYANQSLTYPLLYDLTRQIISAAAPKDYYGEACRLLSWVRQNIEYRRDQDGVDTLHTIPRLLSERKGDCDDMAMLLAAMLKLAGFPAWFVAVGYQPNQYEHVYVETEIDGRRFALECTENWPCGEGPINMPARMELKV